MKHSREFRNICAVFCIYALSSVILCEGDDRIKQLILIFVANMSYSTTKRCPIYVMAYGYYVFVRVYRKHALQLLWYSSLLIMSISLIIKLIK